MKMYADKGNIINELFWGVQCFWRQDAIIILLYTFSLHISSATSQGGAGHFIAGLSSQRKKGSSPMFSAKFFALQGGLLA